MPGPSDALLLSPRYEHRVWGGQRLKPSPRKPFGEAWLVYEHNQVAQGHFAGQTLAQICASEGSRFLGTRVRPGRFPLLIKLLDTQDWLSLQVHPNDQEALRLGGAGHLGKTEAWHILAADAEAKVISGVRPGVSQEALARAIGHKDILDLVDYLPLRERDTVLVPAGALHALGPGLLLYELQQTSDLTFRIYDWDRPASDGRKLHIEEAIQVTRRELFCEKQPPPPGPNAALTQTQYFRLEQLEAQSSALNQDTAEDSFHALTVLEGQMRVRGRGWSQVLGRFESAVVPASAGAYALEPEPSFRALKASL